MLPQPFERRAGAVTVAWSTTMEFANLAEQALANLVNQFARPLDFLRELAQNSIDAGSPRIDVAIAFDPPRPPSTEGVVRITVDDWGEGMDEDIIDNQLTRLFASTKEDDLTKIGKFGIGFTSIFAIQPEAVLLRTGRHGEYWELLFHPDRSFDKVRITEPVDGTKITLFKRMEADDVPRFVGEARFVLGYWCGHSDTPITFWDRTAGDEAPPVDGTDPFAEFTSPPPVSRPREFASEGPAARERAGAAPEPINRPLAIDEAALSLHHREEGIEVVVGYADVVRYGFYNGGLTLLSTPNADALGKYAERLGHLSFKLKHDHLEHTLTRDNVLQDDSWDRAMQAVLRARDHLRDALVDRVEQVVRAGGDPAPWHAWLAAECRAGDSRAWIDKLGGRELFADVGGAPLTLSRIREQERQVGHVLVASAPSPLTAELAAHDVLLVRDRPQTRQLLEASQDTPLFVVFRPQRAIRSAEQLFVMPALLDPGALDPRERALLEATERYLQAAVGVRMGLPFAEGAVQYRPGRDSLLNRLTVRTGDFGGLELGARSPLALNGPRDGRVFQRPGPRLVRLPAFLHWRTLLVNRNHPLFRAQVLAGGEDLDLAAFGLAQALLHVEGLEGERAHQRMVAAFVERGEPAR